MKARAISLILLLTSGLLHPGIALSGPSCPPELAATIEQTRATEARERLERAYFLGRFLPTHLGHTRPASLRIGEISSDEISASWTQFERALRGAEPRWFSSQSQADDAARALARKFGTVFIRLGVGATATVYRHSRHLSSTREAYKFFSRGPWISENGLRGMIRLALHNWCAVQTLASRSTLHGRPFVRTARWLDTPDTMATTLAAGYLRQEEVSGIPAEELANAVHRLRGDPRYVDVLTLSQARTVLQAAGFVDINLAEEYLGAATEFLQHLHEPTDRAIRRSVSPTGGVSNTYEGPGVTTGREQVAVDGNHGSNFIWVRSTTNPPGEFVFIDY